MSEFRSMLSKRTFLYPIDTTRTEINFMVEKNFIKDALSDVVHVGVAHKINHINSIPQATSICKS